MPAPPTNSSCSLTGAATPSRPTIRPMGSLFFKETRRRGQEDGTGPTEGAISAQFKSGKPTWDLVDRRVRLLRHSTLGKQGMIEPIDYTVVDKVQDAAGLQAGTTRRVDLLLLLRESPTTHRNSSPESAERSMVDFFDVAKYPGRPALAVQMGCRHVGGGPARRRRSA